MQSTLNQAIITSQIPEPAVPSPRHPLRRWAEALGWRSPVRSRTLESRFLNDLTQATCREEVHDLLLRAARELTGSWRIEFHPVGGPNRVLVTRLGGKVSPEESLSLPIRYRGELLGTLLISNGDCRRFSPATIARLGTLCGIASLGDRLLGRERLLRMSVPPGPRDDPKPRAILLPFLRQLILMARRRREPLTVLAIGLERPIEEDGPILLRERAATFNPVVGIVLETLRESDLVAQDDNRTLIAVLPNASNVNAPLIAEAIVQAVDDGTSLAPGLGVAIGVACYPGDAREADVLLDVAIDALRRARLRTDRPIVIANREAITPHIIREVREYGVNAPTA